MKYCAGLLLVHTHASVCWVRAVTGRWRRHWWERRRSAPPAGSAAPSYLLSGWHQPGDWNKEQAGLFLTPWPRGGSMLCNMFLLFLTHFMNQNKEHTCDPRMGLQSSARLTDVLRTCDNHLWNVTMRPFVVWVWALITKQFCPERAGKIWVCVLYHDGYHGTENVNNNNIKAALTDILSTWGQNNNRRSTF